MLCFVLFCFLFFIFISFCFVYHTKDKEASRSSHNAFIQFHFSVYAPIDDLNISHNASGMEANIRVLLIRYSSSHSSLDVNNLELPCLAATLCFTRLITKVVRSCAADAKINLSKTVN